MCEILRSAPMWHSIFRPLDNSRDQHIYLELLEDNHFDALHTLGVHPISNQVWQYPLCNVYHLWQPDEMLQQILGLVEDLVHSLLKYLKARNVKNIFDNQFTLVPGYLDIQHFSGPFDSLKFGTWQGNEIRGMIRTLAVKCTPILPCSKDDSKTAAENASNEMIMGAVQS